MIPFSIGITRQEYSVYQYYSQKGRYLDTMDGIFKVDHIYEEPSSNCVMIEGFVDSAKTAFNVGIWIGQMHQMNKQGMGDNYKLTIFYTENEN